MRLPKAKTMWRISVLLGGTHAGQRPGRECRAGQTSLTLIASGPIAYDFYHFSSSRDLIPELCNFFKIMP
jgi:hypothetical protein